MSDPKCFSFYPELGPESPAEGAEENAAGVTACYDGGGALVLLLLHRVSKFPLNLAPHRPQIFFSAKRARTLPGRGYSLRPRRIMITCPVFDQPDDDTWALFGKRQQRPKPST